MKFFCCKSYDLFFKPYWKILTVFALLVITTLSLWPANQLPNVVGGDKLHHLVAYMGLMCLVALPKPKYWLWLAVLFIAWSGVIELIQPSVNRYAEWLDFGVNTLGIVLGAVLGFWLRKQCTLNDSECS